MSKLNQRFFLKSYSGNNVFLYNSRDLELETSGSFRVLNHFQEPVCMCLNKSTSFEILDFKNYICMIWQISNFKIQSLSKPGINHFITMVYIMLIFNLFPLTYLSFIFSHMHLWDRLKELMKTQLINMFKRIHTKTLQHYLILFLFLFLYI